MVLDLKYDFDGLKNANKKLETHQRWPRSLVHALNGAFPNLQRGRIVQQYSISMVYISTDCATGAWNNTFHIWTLPTCQFSLVCAQHEGDFVCPTHGTAVPCVCWIETTRTRVWHAVLFGRRGGNETVLCKHVPLSMAPIINKIGRVCGFVGCMGEFVRTNITILEEWLVVYRRSSTK